MSIPEELSIRQDRLKAIEKAKILIEQRAKERYEKEKAEYDSKVKKRKKKEAAGKKPQGKTPKPPVTEPLSKDQVNLTDEESRIMLDKKAFEQCYNAQACVDMESMLIVGCHVSNNANDKKEIDPSLDELNKLPSNIANIEDLTADTGYNSEYNIQSCLDQNINPLIAQKRDKHHPLLKRDLKNLHLFLKILLRFKKPSID